jgi:electron transfer flavoprotein beta subunit
VKLPDIMKAKKKPLETLASGDLGIEPGPALKAGHYEPPPARQKGVMVADVPGLVAALRDRGLIG